MPKDNNNNLKGPHLFSFLKELGFWKRSNSDVEMLERICPKGESFSSLVPTRGVEAAFVNAVCREKLSMVKCILGIWSIDLQKVHQEYTLRRETGFISIEHHYSDLAAWHLAALNNNLELLKLLIKGVDLTQKITYRRDYKAKEKLPVVKFVTNKKIRAFLAFMCAEYCLQQVNIEEAKIYMEMGKCHEEAAEDYRRQVLATGIGYEFDYSKHRDTLGEIFPELYTAKLIPASRG